MSAARPKPDMCGTLGDLASRYGVFLVDQFGVLHDGVTAYPGAPEALARLHRGGRKVIILSNSGKRARPNIDRFQTLGFPPSSYDHFVASGEVAWSVLRDDLAGGRLRPSARCLLLARGGDRSAIDGLGLVTAKSGEDADVIILSASRGDTVGLDWYADLLSEPAGRGVPMICTNPDKEMVTPDGIAYGSGVIAEEYARMGGPVRWLGKPYPEIYRAALALAGNPDPSTVVCIGDSVEHDILGGARAGLATALVMTGIMRGEGARGLAARTAEHGVHPDHVLSAFAWS